MASSKCLHSESRLASCSIAWDAEASPFKPCVPQTAIVAQSEHGLDQQHSERDKHTLAQECTMQTGLE
eukprot:12220567-Alexandrium_andersonii.AAC.1